MQILLVIDVLLLAFVFVERGWPLLLAVLPYLFLLPGIWKILRRAHGDPDQLKPVAGANVQLHLLFSTGLIAGLLIRLLLPGS